MGIVEQPHGDPTVPEVGEGWDRAVPHDGDPALAYVICAIPRSGSTMLAEALRCTGRLGVPTEYLNRPVVSGPLWARWGCGSWHGYFRDLVRHRTSDNGVFGLKAHWNDLVDLARDAAGCHAAGPEDVRRTLEDVLPGIRYVRLTRADRERGAVSWWRASHTGEWRREGGGRTPVEVQPTYDRAELERAAAHLDALDAGWDRYFAATGIAPMTVTYEALVADHGATVAAVAGWLGVPLHRGEVPPPATVRQADGFTEDVLARWAGDRRREPEG